MHEASESLGVTGIHRGHVFRDEDAMAGVDGNLAALRPGEGRRQEKEPERQPRRGAHELTIAPLPRAGEAIRATDPHVSEAIETVIVGGGQAGLALSYHLRALGREHLLLERGRVAERWRSERWDSLAFQFPNWSDRAAGLALPRAIDPEGFAPRDEVVRFLDDYAHASARRCAPA